ncbi:Dehydrogenase/reductase SDR member 12 [Tieghemiomyces parasiticus]|uniref:Dehydrogenase/reductase SDR member 12 n=1 Tax=Tieghemiomyces parasiticus TaxID=78921 RepID=A0A9W7ZZ49_9FUNG|nr:Dehydrogenase/reductase SDR member 12 [Tieghemiomyces parasiticus]
MDLVRFPIWLANGYSKYTRSGFEKKAKEFNPQALDVSLTGKVAIVTGANSGIGRQTSLELLSKGATVHMVCRNPDRAREARDLVLKEAKEVVINGPTAEALEANLHLVDNVNMDDPRSVRAFAEQFTGQADSQCNILINNAGALLTEHRTTKDGLETSWATNTLGTYYLTELLVPVLARSTDPRVITVSSGGMFLAKLDMDNPQSTHPQGSSFNGNQSYSQEKRQQVELTTLWAHKYGGASANGHPITFLSLHPGWVDTPGVQSSLPSFHKMIGKNLRTLPQGVDTVIWAAVSPEALKVPNGSFLEDRKAISPHLSFCRTHSEAGDPEKLYKYCHDTVTKIMGDHAFYSASKSADV